MGRKRISKRCKGQRGAEEEHEFLTSNRFHLEEDREGDVYYVGPLGHLIWLCASDYWFADKAPAEYTSIEQYLSYLKPGAI